MKQLVAVFLAIFGIGSPSFASTCGGGDGPLLQKFNELKHRDLTVADISDEIGKSYTSLELLKNGEILAEGEDSPVSLEITGVRQDDLLLVNLNLFNSEAGLPVRSLKFQSGPTNALGTNILETSTILKAIGKGADEVYSVYESYIGNRVDSPVNRSYRLIFNRETGTPIALVINRALGFPDSILKLGVPLSVSSFEYRNLIGQKYEAWDPFASRKVPYGLKINGGRLDDAQLLGVEITEFEDKNQVEFKAGPSTIVNTAYISEADVMKDLDLSHYERERTLFLNGFHLVGSDPSQFRNYYLLLNLVTGKPFAMVIMRPEGHPKGNISIFELNR